MLILADSEHTVAVASNVHLVHGRKIVHPVQTGTCLFIKTSEQYVYLVGFLHELQSLQTLHGCT